VTFYGRGDEQPRKSKEQTASGPQSPHFAELDARLSALPVPANAAESWVAMGDTAALPPGWPEKLRTADRLPVIAVHSKTSMLRARRLMTQLIQVVTEVGWRFIAKAPDPPEQPYYRRSDETSEEIARRSAHFLVEGERLFISISERQTRTERPLTAEEQRERRRNPNGYFYYGDRYSYHPSGELTLHASVSPGRGSGFASFRDSKRRPLEVKISDVVRSLLKEALDIKQRRKEAAEAAVRQRQQEERRERIRKRRDAHVHVISRLEAEAAVWARAQRLRRYLRAARHALAPGSSIEVVLEGESIDLLALGEEFADQLDPLHPSSRTMPFFDETDLYGSGFRYESDETKLHRLATRILGGDWRHAPKEIGPQEQPSDRPAADRLLDEES